LLCCSLLMLLLLVVLGCGCGLCRLGYFNQDLKITNLQQKVCLLFTRHTQSKNVPVGRIMSNKGPYNFWSQEHLSLCCIDLDHKKKKSVSPLCFVLPSYSRILFPRHCCGCHWTERDRDRGRD